MAGIGDSPLACSFCGKTNRQVIKLIAGPGVYICDECICLCVEIIAEEMSAEVDDDLASSARRLHENLEDLRELVLQHRQR